MFTKFFKQTLLAAGVVWALSSGFAEAGDFVLRGQGGVNANRYAPQSGTYTGRTYSAPIRQVFVPAAPARVTSASMPTPAPSVPEPASTTPATMVASCQGGCR